MKQKQSLLGDDDDGHTLGFGGDGGSSLKVNQNFARRFEHNKQREELHRLQAKHPEVAARINRGSWQQRKGADGYGVDEDEDESSSEEEDLGEIPDDTEEAILDTLLRIKKKDPLIYKSEVHFFKRDEGDNEEEEKGGNDATLEKKSKPLYLKDVLARQALEHGAELPSSDSEEENERGGRNFRETRAPKVYDEEQEQLKKAFISAVDEARRGVDNEEDADDGIFGGMVKRVGGDDSDDVRSEDDEDMDVKMKDKPAKKGKKGKKLSKMVDAYFGLSDDTNEKFLRDFILNKGWVDKTEEEGFVPRYHDVVGGSDDEAIDDEDQQYLEMADKFEAAYNFRFEEPGGTTIAAHPRVVEGTIRKEDDRRKRKRAEKEARLKEVDNVQREEVKRLKNLKKKEIENKLSTLQKVAGAAAPDSKRVDELLDGDFDPDAWDKQMAEAFNDDYYDAEDEELDAMLADLDDTEIDIAGLDPNLGYEDGEDGLEQDDGVDVEMIPREGKGDGGIASSTFKALHSKLKALKETEDLLISGTADNDSAKNRLARQRAEIQALLEDYYKLDYEDSIAGGLRTRFRYKEVQPLTFGLTTEDILMRTDKELNQVVGLKRLAPYRDDQSKLRPNYKALEELTRGGPGDGHKRSRKQNKQQSQSWQHHKSRALDDGYDQNKQHSQKWQGKVKPAHQHQRPAATGNGNDVKSTMESQPLKKEAKEGKKDAAGVAQIQDGVAQKAGGDVHHVDKGSDGVKHHKAKKQKTQGQGVSDPLASRKASYAKLELRPGKNKVEDKAKGKDVSSSGKHQQQVQEDGTQMKKAHKKNLKRREKKRAAATAGDVAP